MYLKIHAFLVVLSLASSCAWSTKWFAKDDKTNNSQLEQVGAKQEELEKFSVQEAPATPAAVETPPSAAPESKKELPVEKKKTSPSPVVAKKKSTPATAPLTVTPGFAYPADYPEELRKLDEKAAESWKLFQPRMKLNEQMFLDVDYLGMTVGKVVMSYRGIKSMSNKPVHHFQAFFKSAPFYSAIYELDDRVDTFVDQEKFVGLRYNLIQRESKQDVDEVQLYDREALRTTAYQKTVRSDKTKNKKWDGFIPRYSIDPLSVFWLIRGMPMKKGEKYILPIVNKGKVVVLEAVVEDREKITTKVGECQCIRVHANTQSKYEGRTLKSGDMMFWLSDDDERRLMRAKAKIQLGSVYAEAAKEK